ncbi:phage head-tail adapter protein [Campylobacter sp. RM6883]|uniref:portal protein n=1 Tax=Campylobacter californiensis TaxID=1032243 RepID=UPI0014529AB5|nr:phage head-tail adapter protein [Campylobacter sp. RM6914]MBE2985348.1 phage head-tail adapter protein [Campylobacter sp. RM6883]MBE2995881.1 phage head-tail adapter protein [Campylobacter sp. RM6913]QCD51229.1 bacteriophage head to tail connecting protein [Campylobacter sp. RM6914]
MNEDRVAYLEELKQLAVNGFEKYRPAFVKLNSAYLLFLEEMQLQSLKDRNKSRNFIPKLNSKAKRIYDGLTETYFNNDKFAKLEPYINSTNDVIDKWQEAIDHYTTFVNLYKVFAPIFLKASFSPTCIVKVYWSGERVAIDEVAIDEIFFDPMAKNIDNINYIVHKIYLTKEDIKRYAKAKIFKIEADERFYEAKEYERFELYEIYEKTSGKWYVSTLFESSLLRDKVELKDGQPFVFGYMLPQVKAMDEDDYVCAYGEPALASMMPLQDEINVTRNSIIDVIREQTARKLIVPKSMQVSRVDLERVGAPIYADEPSRIVPLPTGDISGAMASLQVIENEMSEVSGVSPQQNGATTVRKETATMASIMANEGSVRLQGYIRTFNETFFEPIFERLAFLVWKYGDPIFFAGFNRGEVPSFRVNLNTGIGALNKEVQKKSLMDVGGLINAQFGMCLQIGDQEGAIMMKEASKKLLLELLPLYGIKNASEYIGETNKLEQKLLCV